MDDELARRRVEYGSDGLRADDLGSDPMTVFAAWLDDATGRATVAEPNAMAFATATSNGIPSVRMVLLKAVDHARGAFTTYTNLDSRKAREADATGSAALCWWWPGTPSRQIRAVGALEHVARAEAAAYFDSRPLGARVGAIASEQSRAVADRARLDARVEQVDPDSLALPDGWGGLRVVADELEFWQGREGRLHDRIAFLRCAPDGTPCSAAAVDAAGGLAAVLAAGVEVVDPHGTRWLRVRLQP